MGAGEGKSDTVGLLVGAAVTDGLRVGTPRALQIAACTVFCVGRQRVRTKKKVLRTSRLE